MAEIDARHASSLARRGASANRALHLRRMAETVSQLIVGRPRQLDEHLGVIRILPVAARRALGPFVFLDHMGPVTLPAGEVELEGERDGVGHLVVATPGAALTARATTASRIAILGGDALDAPRHLDWNLVASSPERLAEARRDWEARRFSTIPGDDVEWIPYPEPRA